MTGPPTVPARRRRAATVTAAATAACALLTTGGASALEWVEPATFPATAFTQLAALRRPAWPMIYGNMDPELKTLFVPTVGAADAAACGAGTWVPPLRNAACFPAGWHWLATQWRMDRDDYWLRLHSVPTKHVTEAAVWADPDNTLWLGSAAPWEVLVARTRVELTRSPRFALTQDTVVDSPQFFNWRSSPLVVSEAYDPETGQLEHVRGMLHAAAEPLMMYPTVTALQYIVAHPHLRTLSALLEATCYCPPRWWATPNATCFAWLCETLEASVATVLAPVDEGWKLLTPEAVDYLFCHPDAAAATVMYWMLGPLTVTGSCASPGGGCAPVGIAAVRPGGFGSAHPFGGGHAGLGGDGGLGGLAGGLWRRLAEAEADADPAASHGVGDGTPSAGPAPSTTHSLRARRHRQLQLLARYDNSTGDVLADAVDWTAPPSDAYLGVEPFPSYLHAAFIGDMVASDPAYLQSARFGTFAPLWNATAVDALVAPFLLNNASDYDPLLGHHGGLPRPLTGLFRDAVGGALPPLFSSGPGGGGGLWTLAPNHTHANHTHRHNASCFVPLDAAAFSFPNLRFLEPAQLAFSFEPLAGGWGAHTGGGAGGYRRRLQPDRTLWASGDLRDPALVVTGIDPTGCVRVDPDNWAQVIVDDATGRADIETLNALLLKIDQPVLPPNVLLALQAGRIPPFLSSPAPEALPPPWSRCPYSPVTPGSLARLMLALQLARPLAPPVAG